MFLIRLVEDESDNLAAFAAGEDCLLPRLLLPRQLGRLHLLPGPLATQGTACKRGGLLSLWGIYDSKVKLHVWNKGESCWRPLLWRGGQNSRIAGCQAGLGMGSQGEEIRTGQGWMLILSGSPINHLVKTTMWVMIRLKLVFLSLSIRLACVDFIADHSINFSQVPSCGCSWWGKTR